MKPGPIPSYSQTSVRWDWEEGARPSTSCLPGALSVPLYAGGFNSHTIPLLRKYSYSLQIRKKRNVIIKVVLEITHGARHTQDLSKAKALLFPTGPG